MNSDSFDVILNSHFIQWTVPLKMVCVSCLNKIYFFSQTVKIKLLEH